MKVHPAVTSELKGPHGRRVWLLCASHSPSPSSSASSPSITTGTLAQPRQKALTQSSLGATNNSCVAKGQAKVEIPFSSAVRKQTPTPPPHTRTTNSPMPAPRSLFPCDLGRA